MTVREARVGDAAAIARVHVDSWRTTYRGIVPDDYLAQLSYEAREQWWQRALTGADRRQFVYVAEDAGGEIVGFASGGPQRNGDPVYTGELYTVYLLATHQGRGLGRALTRAVAERLAEAGMQAMLVWVLAANPACRFYEALGGHRLRTQPIRIGSTELEEVAYGWPDVRVLLHNE